MRETVGRRSFDIVLCHGVMMYLAEPEPALDELAHAVAPGGILSLLVRNGDALAMRPGLAGNWQGAARAFDTTSYVNRLDLPARADRLEDLRAELAKRGLSTSCWYGVRVFSDMMPSDQELPPDDELAALIAVEEKAGRTDPYRAVAPLLHLVSTRGLED